METSSETGLQWNDRVRLYFDTESAFLIPYLAAYLLYAWLKIESGRPNEIATFPTLEQVRDAEAAFRRLEPAGRSLLFSADFTLANYSKPAREMLLTDAAKEYVALERFLP